MNKHEASVHVRKCDICEYRCFLKSTMKTHVASVHEEKKLFKEDSCDIVESRIVDWDTIAKFTFLLINNLCNYMVISKLSNKNVPKTQIKL